MLLVFGRVAVHQLCGALSTGVCRSCWGCRAALGEGCTDLREEPEQSWIVASAGLVESSTNFGVAKCVHDSADLDEVLGEGWRGLDFVLPVLLLFLPRTATRFRGLT